jgi:hypothetical protein
MLRPSRHVAALAALLLALVAAGPAQAAKPKPRRAAAPACAVRGSTTVALDPQARVYVLARRGESDQHDVFGCLLRGGRTFRLDSWFSCGCSRGDEAAPQVWLRGTVVAVNHYSCPPDPTLGACAGSARTVDLRTRRTLRAASTGSAVAALVIGPRGAFAYVSAGGAVAKADADGAGIVLENGSGIDASSLAVGGRWVYWMRAGAPRSTRLRP